MAIRVALHHRTTYIYSKTIHLGPQIVRLRPAPHCRTPVLSYSLSIVPSEHFCNWQQDPQGNYLARLIFNEPTKKFEVTLDCDEDEDEDWQTLRIMRNGEVVRLETDGGEPEDQSFYRDWAWVADAIRQAYEYGLEDGAKQREKS